MVNSSVEDTYFREKFSIGKGDKKIDLTTPAVMAIVNITPDSFYSESRANTKKAVLERVETALSEGADIIDLGAYSTRPGAGIVSVDDELNRILPVLKAVSNHFKEAFISVDTFRAPVAHACIESGAQMINDVSGFQFDPRLVEVVAKNQAAYVLMHMCGTPENFTKTCETPDLLPEILRYFQEKLAILEKAGVKDIVLDPGFGFGKTLIENHGLIRHFDAFSVLDRPTLVGISRKSMISRKLGVSAEESLHGTIALHAIALSKGAHILRVHDVKEAVELIQLLS